jgi:adenosylhomocysteine nucleosidase
MRVLPVSSDAVDASTAPVIAFVCAMPMELKPLAKKLALRKTTLGGVDVRAGTFAGRTVVAVATGMGTDLATHATERLLAAVPVERVVVFGITGAVENETPIGTLILPEVVVDSESGDEYRPEPLADGVPHGKMWTTNVLNTDLDVVAGLRAQGVVSLDMETAAIARACEQRDIPWSVFRTISDRATDGSVDEEVFRLSNQDGTPNPVAVLRYFLLHPQRIPRMARLAKGALRATEAAADAAIAAAAKAVA